MRKLTASYPLTYLLAIMSAGTVLFAAWLSGLALGLGNRADSATVAGLGLIAWYIFFRCCRCVLR